MGQGKDRDRDPIDSVELWALRLPLHPAETLQCLQSEPGKTQGERQQQSFWAVHQVKTYEA